jgi:hypothetical protein
MTPHNSHAVPAPALSTGPYVSVYTRGRMHRTAFFSFDSKDIVLADFPWPQDEKYFDYRSMILLESFV